MHSTTKANAQKSQKLGRTGEALRYASSRGLSPGQQFDDASVDDNFGITSKIELLEQDLETSQEKFVKRERAYKQRIHELEEEIANQRKEKTGWMMENEKMTKLKEMQGLILNRVELVQDRTAKILQEQERDLLRAFRTRLFDVQTELEKEKSKKDDGAVAWIERSRRLEAEVEWAKEVADKLEGVNQAMLQENNRLKSQFQYSKQEHGFMMEKLSALTSENEVLRKRYSDREAENEALRQQQRTAMELQQTTASEGRKGPGHKMVPHDAEERYKESNIKLKKQLEEERRALKSVLDNLKFEVSSQTDLERVLRQCVDDVRKEMARRNVESAHYTTTADLAKLYSKTPALIPIDDFSQTDRERVLELMLSQERVVTLLYGKAVQVPYKMKGGLLSLGDNVSSAPSLVTPLQLGGEEAGGGSGPGSSDPEVGRPNTAGAASGDGKLPSVHSARPNTGK